MSQITEIECKKINEIRSALPPHARDRLLVEMEDAEIYELEEF